VNVRATSIVREAKDVTHNNHPPTIWSCRSPLVGAGVTGDGRLRGHPGRVDREHRVAVDRSGASHLAGQPVVGGQRVRFDLRRVFAVGWSDRRPSRPPPDLHGGPGRVLAGVAAGRTGSERAVVVRRARGAGPRGGATRARRAVAGHVDFLRGRGAQPGAVGVGCGRGLGRRRRGAVGRCFDQRSGMALGAVRQRADRDRRDPADPAAGRGEPR
jgi:hypothetical protein